MNVITETKNQLEICRKQVKIQGEVIGSIKKKEAGLPEPQFNYDTSGFELKFESKKIGKTYVKGGFQNYQEVSEHIKRLLLVIDGEMKRSEIQGELGIRHEDFF